MTANLVDAFVMKYGDGWIIEAYHAGTADPVPSMRNYGNKPTHRTEAQALEAARRRYGPRLARLEVIK